jgi:hypothetical protein
MAEQATVERHVALKAKGAEHIAEAVTGEGLGDLSGAPDRVGGACLIR